MPVRKIKAGYASVTGRFPSRKLDRMVDAESTLERDFFLLLEYRKKVDWYEEQPLTVSYIYLGRDREYTPDTLVRDRDGEAESYTLYEVKFRSELRKNWSELKPKFKAAIKFCRGRGWRFKIITDVEIRTQRLRNLEFLDFFCRSVTQSEDAYRLVLMEAMRRLVNSTPKELLAATFIDPMNRAEVLPVLWRMIADGSIGCNLDNPLTMNSVLHLVGDDG